MGQEDARGSREKQGMGSGAAARRDVREQAQGPGLIQKGLLVTISRLLRDHNLNVGSEGPGTRATVSQIPVSNLQTMKRGCGVMTQKQGAPTSTHSDTPREGLLTQSRDVCADRRLATCR